MKNDTMVCVECIGVSQGIVEAPREERPQERAWDRMVLQNLSVGFVSVMVAGKRPPARCFIQREDGVLTPEPQQALARSLRETIGDKWPFHNRVY